MRRIMLILLVCLLLAGAFVLFAPRGPAGDTFVDIAPGTSSRQIGMQLEAQHVIWSRYGFDAMRLLRRGRLKAGEYRFDRPQRVGVVYGRLLKGDVYTLAVTVPEGANIFDIAQRVESAHLGTRAAFLKAAHTDTGLIRDLDRNASSLEGYLFPDTYQFPPTVTADQMAASMVKEFRRAALGIHLTTRQSGTGEVHRLVTMASLIERETPIEAERPLVASVFINRLERNMPLMTDPSVIYAALLEGRYRGSIFESDLAAESPYNTYKHAGLPPGPICNPGLTSLKAALSPASSNYFYFVAVRPDGSGRSRFATTLEQHERNVAAYRAASGEARNPVAAPKVKGGHEAYRAKDRK